MRFRCVYYRRKQGWMGVCLETSIVACGDTPQETNRMLMEMIDDYVKTWKCLVASGTPRNFVAVPGYWWKSRLFDVVWRLGICRWDKRAKKEPSVSRPNLRVVPGPQIA